MLVKACQLYQERFIFVGWGGDRCVALSRLVFDFMSGEEFREEDGVSQVLAPFFSFSFGNFDD
jgi:hypothetical protein